MPKEIPEVFNAYVMIEGVQLLCCVNKQVVKLFPISDDKSSFRELFYNKSYKGQFIHGFDESNCNISIHITREITKFFTSHYATFSTALIIKSFSNANPSEYDWEYFNKIEFRGGILNSLFSPLIAIDGEKSLLCLDQNTEAMGEMTIQLKPFLKTGTQKQAVLFGQKKVNVNLGTLRPGSPTTRKGSCQSLALGDINSSLTLTFAEKQPFEEIVRCYRLFNNWFSFLAAQFNICFETRISIPNKNEKGYSDTAICCFFNKYEDYCEKDSYKVIPLGEVMNDIGSCLELFSSKELEPYMQFLPSSNNECLSITFNNIRDICTSFEKEFGLSGLALNKNLENLISKLKATVKEFKKNNDLPFEAVSLAYNAINNISRPLRSKMKLMYDYYKGSIDELFQGKKEYEDYEFSEKSFQDFVKLRNNITHMGQAIWPLNTRLVYNVLKSMIYLSFFERAGIETKLATEWLGPMFYWYQL